jgi:hypothetical protein
LASIHAGVERFGPEPDIVPTCPGIPKCPRRRGLPQAIGDRPGSNNRARTPFLQRLSELLVNSQSGAADCEMLQLGFRLTNFDLVSDSKFPLPDIQRRRAPDRVFDALVVHGKLLFVPMVQFLSYVRALTHRYFSRLQRQYVATQYQAGRPARLPVTVSSSFREAACIPAVCRAFPKHREYQTS